ncbi:MAG: YebC/PmpR family DNA-binding transcriptional regulator, partial [Candidatus Omnitrophica bacterium]|nr:YebC/PmpR family DNA-binding transcriptional regulator [Candidatus Omnitrophota bacterium]
DEDKLMNLVLEAGAEDMSTQEENYEITTTAQDFEKVKKALTDASVKCVSAEVTMISSNTIKLTGNDAKTAVSLVAELEDLDDVQNVYANFDVPDDIIKEISGE